MTGLVFDNLIKMDIINDELIAIYYLNNLHPNNNRFDLDSKDTIKQLITSKFISESEIKDSVIAYFNTMLKSKPFVQRLAIEHFIHQPDSHTFS